ncbi:MAG: 4'-phosphopantetheinyl transferase superfamily protein [Clostridia bacterium]|nr:4'-phosphopantetheinyl transferase superfamily protein [Clostridia bacterium]
MEIRILFGRIVSCDNLRDRHAAASAAGRELLSRLLAECFPGEMPSVAKTDLGKPYLPDYPEVGISVSHSGDYAVAAIAPGPVGIDLERLREPTAGVLKKYFSKEERDLVSAGGADVFTRLWTTKEAIGKALGTGLLNRELFEKSGRAVLVELGFAACFPEAPEGYLCTLVVEGEVLRNPPKCAMI